MDIPTMEEFTEGVKKLVKDLVGYISDEETEQYIQSDKTKRVIKNRYDHSIKRMEDGEITAEVFRCEVEVSLANCLALMY